MEESFLIVNRFGEKLKTLLRKPKEQGRFPAVLFVSGFGMDLHEYINSNDEISKRLVKNRFITLQFSFAGCGKSEGNYNEMTIQRQADQVEDVIAGLKKNNDVDVEQIGLHATSFGVPSSIATDLSDIASMCLVAGAFYPGRSLRRVFIEERGVVINQDGETALPRSSGQQTKVGKDFWKSIDAFDPKKYTKKLNQPVLVIHGDQDTKISTPDMKKAFGSIASKKKKLKIFKGGDHGITDVPRKKREEFLNEVVEWFKLTCK